jgi:isobutyryl-CoA mutase
MRVQAVSQRGGVLGAMDTMYQRGKIQEESMYYEHKKHDGSLPLIGVNTFLPKDQGGEIATEIELIRSTEEEKGQQIQNVKLYGEAPNALASDSLKVLQTTARDRRNVFKQLVEAVKYNSVGQISHALSDAGEEYRSNTRRPVASSARSLCRWRLR